MVFAAGGGASLTASAPRVADDADFDTGSRPGGRPAQPRPSYHVLDTEALSVPKPGPGGNGDPGDRRVLPGCAGEDLTKNNDMYPVNRRLCAE